MRLQALQAGRGLGRCSCPRCPLHRAREVALRTLRRLAASWRPPAQSGAAGRGSWPGVQSGSVQAHATSGVFAMPLRANPHPRAACVPLPARSHSGMWYTSRAAIYPIILQWPSSSLNMLWLKCACAPCRLLRDSQRRGSCRGALAAIADGELCRQCCTLHVLRTTRAAALPPPELGAQRDFWALTSCALALPVAAGRYLLFVICAAIP
jgi:hypothetical protein